MAFLGCGIKTYNFMEHREVFHSSRYVQRIPGGIDLDVSLGSNIQYMISIGNPHYIVGYFIIE